jgi:enoyl-CoA hydratase/carnithine racemase
MADDVLVVEVADRVATVTMNRPQARNALNRDLQRALYKGMLDLETNDEVDAVVLTGADPAFCAGLDLKELGSATASDNADGAEAVAAATPDETVDVIRRGPFPIIAKPVIGAINGPAITGGFEVALRCDWLVASERGRFADTHARMGIMPGWGLSVLLPQAVGVRRAREMSLTGNFLDAPTALTWGLVNHVVPHDELLPFCRQLAADIVSNDQHGVRRMLATYQEGSLVSVGEAWEVEARVARTWQGGGIDPAQVEARRKAVIARGRSQM